MEILSGALGPESPWGHGKTLPFGFTKLSWIHLPQALPLPSQGLQMEWPPCPGLLCSSSWLLLGLDPSRLGPWTGVSSPKTGRTLAVQPMSYATASTETSGSEVFSSVLLASLGATSWSIPVTRSVSMPTTSPSAGLLGTPSHSRTWFLLAASEPVSERRCSSVPHSLMVRWSTPPCSGPACSELQRPMGCGCVFGKSLSKWPQVHLCVGG